MGSIPRDAMHGVRPGTHGEHNLCFPLQAGTGHQPPRPSTEDSRIVLMVGDSRIVPAVGDSRIVPAVGDSFPRWPHSSGCMAQGDKEQIPEQCL